jgi:hypothetical protein
VAARTGSGREVRLSAAAAAGLPVALALVGFGLAAWLAAPAHAGFVTVAGARGPWLPFTDTVHDRRSLPQAFDLALSKRAGLRARHAAPPELADPRPAVSGRYPLGPGPLLAGVPGPALALAALDETPSTGVEADGPGPDAAALRDIRRREGSW